MNKLGIVFLSVLVAALLSISILDFMAGSKQPADKDHVQLIQLENGLNCAVFEGNKAAGLSCNWSEFNN